MPFSFWASVFALIALSGLCLWRRAYKTLPVFFFFTVSAWLFGVLRYYAFRVGGSFYFYLYWISELAGAAIVSLALYEVFLRRLFPRFYKVRFYRALFPLAAGAVLLLTIAAVLQSSDRNAAFQTASRAYDFMRTACLVFFMLLVSLMGRNWTRYDLGVTLGFGIQAVVALVNAAVRARFGQRSPMLDSLESIAFEIACVIWLITFLKPEKTSQLQPSGPPDPAVLQQARKWETALKDWLTPGKQIF